MVVRINNVTKWKALQPGEYLELPGGENRKVKLQVNCPSPTRVDLLVNDVPTFLAVVQGFEEIQFSASGLVELTFSAGEDLGAEVWYFTDDGDNFASENVKAASFVKLMSRRTRNPQLELMMFKQEQNALRREELLRVELAAAREAQNVGSGPVVTEPVVDPATVAGAATAQPVVEAGSAAPAVAG